MNNVVAIVVAKTVGSMSLLEEEGSIQVRFKPLSLSDLSVGSESGSDGALRQSP